MTSQSKGQQPTNEGHLTPQRLRFHDAVRVWGSTCKSTATFDCIDQQGSEAQPPFDLRKSSPCTRAMTLNARTSSDMFAKTVHDTPWW